MFDEQEQDICLTANFNQHVIDFLFVVHPSLNNVNRSKIWGKKA